MDEDRPQTRPATPATAPRTLSGPSLYSTARAPAGADEIMLFKTPIGSRGQGFEPMTNVETNMRAVSGMGIGMTIFGVYFEVLDGPVSFFRTESVLFCSTLFVYNLFPIGVMSWVDNVGYARLREHPFDLADDPEDEFCIRQARDVEGREISRTAQEDRKRWEVAGGRLYIPAGMPFNFFVRSRPLPEPARVRVTLEVRMLQPALFWGD